MTDAHVGLAGQLTRLPQRQVLSDDVYETVKGLIMDSVVEPGTRLNIDALTRELGISQTPDPGVAGPAGVRRAGDQGAAARLPGVVPADPGRVRGPVRVPAAHRAVGGRPRRRAGRRRRPGPAQGRDAELHRRTGPAGLRELQGDGGARPALPRPGAGAVRQRDRPAVLRPHPLPSAPVPAVLRWRHRDKGVARAQDGRDRGPQGRPSRGGRRDAGAYRGLPGSVACPCSTKRRSAIRRVCGTAAPRRGRRGAPVRARRRRHRPRPELRHRRHRRRLPRRRRHRPGPGRAGGRLAAGRRRRGPAGRRPDRQAGRRGLHRP